jgi:hypothetical protein
VEVNVKFMSPVKYPVFEHPPHTPENTFKVTVTVPLLTVKIPFATPFTVPEVLYVPVMVYGSGVTVGGKGSAVGVAVATPGIGDAVGVGVDTDGSIVGVGVGVAGIGVAVGVEVGIGVGVEVGQILLLLGVITILSVPVFVSE